jgi:hypothetical protein
MSADRTPTLAEVVEFLCGEAPLEGVWFGEDHPTKPGKFWWRPYLRAALSPTPKEDHED